MVKRLSEEGSYEVKGLKMNRGLKMNHLAAGRDGFFAWFSGGWLFSHHEVILVQDSSGAYTHSMGLVSRLM